MLQTLSSLLLLFFPSNSHFTICHGNGSVSVVQDFLGSEKKEVALSLKAFSSSVQSVNLTISHNHNEGGG